MRRRCVLQLGLCGIAALGVLPRIGAQRAMAADGHETFVYVSNAGTKDIYFLGMNRETGELTMVEKVPVPGAEKTSLVSLPMALAPNRRFIYAQLRSEPYPVSTFSIDHTNGRLAHLDATPLVDQMAYINVDKTGKHLLGASYTGAKVAVYPIDARYIVEDNATQIIDTKPKGALRFHRRQQQACVCAGARRRLRHAVQVRCQHRHADAQLSAHSCHQGRRRPAPFHHPPERQMGLSHH
jgi:6-phosphogluconolactonase